MSLPVMGGQKDRNILNKLIVQSLMFLSHITRIKEKTWPIQEKHLSTSYLSHFPLLQHFIDQTFLSYSLSVQKELHGRYFHTSLMMLAETDHRSPGI